MRKNHPKITRFGIDFSHQRYILIIITKRDVKKDLKILNSGLTGRNSRSGPLSFTA
jgi:hypothetical protein